MNQGGASWDLDLISDIFNARDRALILQVPYINATREDRLMWTLEAKGMFSVKIA